MKSLEKHGYTFAFYCYHEINFEMFSLSFEIEDGELF